MNGIYNYLESKYNDGDKYIPHYLMAREFYNIVKAAEAGELSSNPHKYRDYLLAPPAYDASLDIPEASIELKSLTARTFQT